MTVLLQGARAFSVRRWMLNDSQDTLKVISATLQVRM